MAKIHLSRSLLIIGSLLILSACDYNPLDRGPQAHDIAIEFFDRLYNQRDLESALELTSQEYRPVLERYGSIVAIGRYLYGMNFDEVTIEADSQGVQLYRERAETARVQISFSGRQGQAHVETLRNVVMVQEGGEWRLARVLDTRW